MTVCFVNVTTGYVAPLVFGENGVCVVANQTVNLAMPDDTYSGTRLTRPTLGHKILVSITW